MHVCVCTHIHMFSHSEIKMPSKTFVPDMIDIFCHIENICFRYKSHMALVFQNVRTFVYRKYLNQTRVSDNSRHYEEATISWLLKTMGLFCKISSLLKGSFVKETFNFKEHTNRSHPIVEGHKISYV